MRVIHKYEIKQLDYNYIEMPVDAILLHGMVIKNKLFIWLDMFFNPDEEKETEKRVFFLTNTGKSWLPMYNVYEHINTIQFDNEVVQHLFEAKYPIKNV